jgi:hypothetical protein
MSAFGSRAATRPRHADRRARFEQHTPMMLVSKLRWHGFDTGCPFLFDKMRWQVRSFCVDVSCSYVWQLALHAWFPGHCIGRMPAVDGDGGKRCGCGCGCEGVGPVGKHVVDLQWVDTRAEMPVVERWVATKAQTVQMKRPKQALVPISEPRDEVRQKRGAEERGYPQRYRIGPRQVASVCFLPPSPVLPAWIRAAAADAGSTSRE